MFFFFSSRRRHTRCGRDWSSDVCSSDLAGRIVGVEAPGSPEPYAKLLEMLDWDDGELEFRACEVSASDDVDCSISRLLFEHASLAEDRDTAVRSVDTLVRACIS